MKNCCLLKLKIVFGAKILLREIALAYEFHLNLFISFTSKMNSNAHCGNKNEILILFSENLTYYPQHESLIIHGTHV